MKENYEKILIAINPIIPHFSSECLSLINSKDFTWPKYNQTLLKEENVNIVIQVNGKKRELIKTKINISEEKLLEIIKDNKLLKKYLDNQIIKRKIFVKNKLLNIII